MKQEQQTETKPVTDRVGRPIVVGNWVVFANLVSGNAGLSFGRVANVSPAGVIVLTSPKDDATITIKLTLKPIKLAVIDEPENQ